MRGPSHILASDLDGTLIAPPGVEDRAAVDAFGRRFGDRADVMLAYVTGRHFSFALEGVREASLPLPDVLVCDVGTSLYRREAGGFTPDASYAEKMREAMGGASGDVAREALATVPGVELQEEEKQGRFKASGYFDWERRDEVVARSERRLAESDIRVNLVASRDPATGRGLLDALPPGAAKDYALHHLRRSADLAPEQVAFAGDSGNDRHALLAGYRGIVVGNAPTDLVEELRAEARERGVSELIYFARAPYAAGVLEGCDHFGLP